LTYSEISTAVAKLIKKYDERNPFRLCRAMGIKLIFQPMGTAPDAVKGFFLKKNRIRVIVINSDLPEIIQRIIGAHELCHAEFHRKSGIHAFHEVTLFDQTSEFEKDANLFAAELLLEDKEVLDVLNQDTTFFSAAAMLLVPAELLDFKFRVMKWKGFKMIEPPINARSNFMKDMEIPEDADYYN
jgi:Zn-dependent peptidase ImmA (M78 family)